MAKLLEAIGLKIKPRAFGSAFYGNQRVHWGYQLTKDEFGHISAPKHIRSSFIAFGKRETIKGAN
uniref:Uncharacterized protein n=1 Tax=Arundo donax TaxID=35708 RepID=A0A0A9DEQ3_ARUDO